MTLRGSFKHSFVQFIPEDVEEGVLYVSIDYATAVHKCACGCGSEVVTPLSPTDWNLTYDGETVSLFPSIGSWSLPCQSHYFIRRNKTRSVRRWSASEIETSRKRYAALKRAYYDGERVDDVDDLHGGESPGDESEGHDRDAS